MEGMSVHVFKERLSHLIESKSDRDGLYRGLRDYQMNHDVSGFMNVLKSVITQPAHLKLFDNVRPFIQPAQQIIFDQLVPQRPSNKIRTIRLVRQGDENLGFSVRGGTEFGVGALVADVTPQSLAARKKLKIGDEILSVNGYNISEALHNEVIFALKVKRTITLKVSSVGMLPVKKAISDPVTWTLVTERRHSFQSESGVIDDGVDSDRKVYVNLMSGRKLGCGIGTGPSGQNGIFILKVSPGSAAQALNFKVGDQILDVNGTSFLDISHEAAVMELKSSSHLSITLRSKQVQAEGEAAGEAKAEAEAESPSTKLSNLDVGADVSPIPKQASGVLGHSPETGEPNLYQSKTVEKDQPREKSDDSDSGNSQHGRNLSSESKKQTEKASHPDAGKKTAGKKSQGKSKHGSWWNKDPHTLFNHRQIDGRKLCKVEVNKDEPLGMLVEGGLGSPLAGKIVISEIYSGGAADRTGELFKGDQLMMVDGKSMIDIPLNVAQEILKAAMANQEGVLRIISAAAPVKEYEDEITFF